MSKRIWSIICVVLCLGLVFSLVACGSSDDKENDVIEATSRNDADAIENTSEKDKEEKESEVATPQNEELADESEEISEEVNEDSDINDEVVVEEDIVEENNTEDDSVSVIDRNIYSSSEEPSEEVILALTRPFQELAINGMNGSDVVGKMITPNNNQACELAACAYFWDYGGPDGTFSKDPMSVILESYILPEDGLKTYLMDFFGPSYNLDDFSNTIDNNLKSNVSGLGITSSFGEDNTWNYCTLYRYNDFYEYSYALSTTYKSMGDVNIISSNEVSGGNHEYNVRIEYCAMWPEDENIADSALVGGARTADFVLVADDSSDFGWTIKSLMFNAWDN